LSSINILGRGIISERDISLAGVMLIPQVPRSFFGALYRPRLIDDDDYDDCGTIG
jgi:hypothetical protein